MAFPKALSPKRFLSGAFSSNAHSHGCVAFIRCKNNIRSQIGSFSQLNFFISNENMTDYVWDKCCHLPADGAKLIFLAIPLKIFAFLRCLFVAERQWSNGKRTWLLRMRPGFDSRHQQKQRAILKCFVLPLGIRW